jgi:ribosomal protein S18 acetylase RimI-like enzyme
MQSRDLLGVAQLLTAAFTPTTDRASYTRQAPITDDLVYRWQAQCAGAWVVDATGFGPVGAAFAVVEPDAGWLAGIGVHPAYQRIGVGRTLIDKAVEFLDESGCAVIGLEVSPSHGDVLGAYARRGFRPVDVTLRLRSGAAYLAMSGPPAPLHTAPFDSAASASAEHDQVAKCALALPLSGSAFRAVGSGTNVICDLGIGLPGTALDIRTGFVDPDPGSIAAAFSGLAGIAVSRGLRHVEVDLAVGPGMALATLCEIGFQTVGTAIRMARPDSPYHARAGDRVRLGRWTL